jgi:hypothetical protein
MVARLLVRLNILIFESSDSIAFNTHNGGTRRGITWRDGRRVAASQYGGGSARSAAASPERRSLFERVDHYPFDGEPAAALA